MSGGARQEDKVNTFGVVLIGVASAILVWATIVFLQAYYDQTEGKLNSERSAINKDAEVRALRAEQVALLSEARYVAGTTPQLATMPIDIAMKKVIEDARAGKPLVPAIGEANKPTIPAVPGKPADAASAPAPAPGADRPAAQPPGAAPMAPAPAPAKEVPAN
jgi:hypothetical protein